MKKLLFAILVIAMGTLGAAHYAQQASHEQVLRSQMHTEANHVANHAQELASQQAALQAEIQIKKLRLSQAVSVDTEAHFLDLVKTAKSKQGWGAASAEIRKNLGITWDSSPDFVLINKSALKEVFLPGREWTNALSDSVANVLALTPEERAAIEASLLRMAAAHQAWFNTAIERVPPSGDLLAEYKVPANPELFNEAYKKEMAALETSLGTDRGEMLRQFTGVWKLSHEEMGEDATRFTLHQSSKPGSPMWCMIEHAEHTRSAPVKPGTFPPAFLAAFPGGWHDLAQQEGFQLPSDFDSPVASKPPSAKN